jgi:hypothetical protein
MPDQPSPRRHFQFRLRTLMIAVTAAGLAMAALHFATSGWAIATVSVTVSLLLFSIVPAAYRRPFWVGFAICGIGYLVLMVASFASELRSYLITKQSVWFLQQMLHPVSNYPAAGAYELVPAEFNLIGDCLWALILGFAGGILAQFIATRSGTRS